MKEVILAQSPNQRQTNYESEQPTYTYEIVSVLILVVLLYVVCSGSKKGKVGFARFANVWDKINAVKKAEKQIREKRVNKVSLYCGTPKNRGFSAVLSTFLGHTPTKYVVDAQRGSLVVGAPESGKSFSFIDPCIRSAIDQGFPILCFDSQEVQIKAHAAYAAKAGYEVFAFAPGKPYSGRLNITEFVKDPGDKLRSHQLAQVLNRNSDSDPSARKDKFFFSAADGVVQMAIMLAKYSGYPDIIQAFQILTLPNLVERLQYASQSKSISPWISMAASTLSMASQAPETISGILSTATVTLRNLIDRDYMHCLCGQSTIPKRLEGKQILFLVLDQQTGEVMAPLLAAAIHLLILENFSNDRQTPLVVSLDELPTIYLPQLVDWINTLRKKGFCPLLGIQNVNQLISKYGQNGAESIIGATGTKSIFNPNHGATAKRFSDYFGESDKFVRTRSRTSGTRQYSSGSSEQLHKLPLVSVDRFNTLPNGHCVYTNPGYGSGKSTNHCILGKFHIPKSDRHLAEESEALWPKVRDRLSDINSGDPHMDYSAELHERAFMAESILPEPFPSDVVDGDPDVDNYDPDNSREEAA